jgi:membrane protease YdiL (CAAX protease family)
VFSFSLFSFLPYILIAIILIAFQIAAEEVLFRSYLLHGLTRLFRYRWLGILLQAILFGVSHGANPEVTSYGLLTTMPFYIGIGLLLGWFSFRSKGLEIALGLHFANNLYATSMVTFSESAIPSPAIFTITNYQPEIGLVAFVIMAIIFTVVMMKLN